jgi:hypothetical protein
MDLVFSSPQALSMKELLEGIRQDFNARFDSMLGQMETFEARILDHLSLIRDQAESARNIAMDARHETDYLHALRNKEIIEEAETAEETKAPALTRESRKKTDEERKRMSIYDVEMERQAVTESASTVRPTYVAQEPDTSKLRLRDVSPRVVYNWFRRISEFDRVNASNGYKAKLITLLDAGAFLDMGNFLDSDEGALLMEEVRRLNLVDRLAELPNSLVHKILHKMVSPSSKEDWVIKFHGGIDMLVLTSAQERVMSDPHGAATVFYNLTTAWFYGIMTHVKQLNAEGGLKYMPQLTKVGESPGMMQYTYVKIEGTAAQEAFKSMSELLDVDIKRPRANSGKDNEQVFKDWLNGLANEVKKYRDQAESFHKTANVITGNSPLSLAKNILPVMMPTTPSRSQGSRGPIARRLDLEEESRDPSDSDMYLLWRRRSR